MSANLKRSRAKRGFRRHVKRLARGEASWPRKPGTVVRSRPFTPPQVETVSADTEKPVVAQAPAPGSVATTPAPNAASVTAAGAMFHEGQTVRIRSTAVAPPPTGHGLAQRYKGHKVTVIGRTDAEGVWSVRSTRKANPLEIHEDHLETA